MLDRPAILAAWIFLAMPAAASAQALHPKPAIMPPLSQYGSLSSPDLQLTGLNAATRQVVESAIAIAGQASGKAAAAEDLERAATRAAAQGRDAERKAQAGRAGYGILDVSFDRASCRYGGMLTNHRASGFGMMACPSRKIAGQFQHGRPGGLGIEERPDGGYLGQYKDGRRSGLGGDYSLRTSDAYEGVFADGQRVGLGIERDQDGAYPGLYGFVTDPRNTRHRINMEIMGLQDFRGSHWAGRYASYTGPKIACTLVQGAVLEGSVLDGYGAKFDAGGRVTEQGLYHIGIHKDGAGPPC